MTDNEHNGYEEMKAMAAHEKKIGSGYATFTLEREQGETYNSQQWALYCHSEYESSSVLAGQSKRIYCRDIGTEADADAFLKGCPKGYFDGVLFPQLAKIEGTTHIPVDQVVGHLPDEDGNCWYGRTPDHESDW